MEKNLGPEAAKMPPKRAGKWKIIVIAALFIFFLLGIWIIGLFRTPAYFRTVQIIDDNQISQYLSNVILPQFYNKSQIPEPFEIVFEQEGINEIISRHIKAEDLKRWGFSDISITFISGRVLLVGKTKYHGFDFIVTAVFKPDINEKGFNAGLKTIKAGISEIPFGPKILSDRILYKLAGGGWQSDAVHYAGVLFSDNRMPAEFKFDHRNIKIKKISVENEKLIITFLPD
jgi:hypothetical protein